MELNRQYNSSFLDPTLHNSALVSLGREIAARYGVRSIPTLLVLDDGREVYRQDGMPDRGEIVRRASAL